MGALIAVEDLSKMGAYGSVHFGGTVLFHRLKLVFASFVTTMLHGTLGATGIGASAIRVSLTKHTKKLSEPCDKHRNMNHN